MITMKEVEEREETLKKARGRLLGVSKKHNPRAYDAAVEAVEQAERALFTAYSGITPQEAF